MKSSAQRTKCMPKCSKVTPQSAREFPTSSATAQIWSEQVSRRIGGLVSWTSRREAATNGRRSRIASSSPGSRQTTLEETTGVTRSELVGEASTPIVLTSQQSLAGPRMLQSVVSGPVDCGQQHVRRTISSYLQRNSSPPCAHPAKSSAGSISIAEKRRRTEPDMRRQACWPQSILSRNAGVWVSA